MSKKSSEIPIELLSFSGIENENEIYSNAQLEAQDLDAKLGQAHEYDDNIVLAAKTIRECGVTVDRKPPEVVLTTVKRAIQPAIDQTVAITAAAKSIDINKSVENLPEEPTGNNKVDFVEPIRAIIQPLQGGGVFVVNRPRSVTDALFAAAPEIPQVVNNSSIHRPYSVTEKVGRSTRLSCQPKPQQPKAFVDRTEDMNKGFFLFSDDEPGLTSEYTILFSVIVSCGSYIFCKWLNELKRQKIRCIQRKLPATFKHGNSYQR